MAAPERTCVGCRGKASKHDLVRVARADGELVVDASGSAPGRGAYVHLDVGCILAAMRSRAFDRALRTGLSADAAARLGNGLERTIGAV
jgi:Predicted nucleic-acid-binding protein implicated in transcription termination